MFKQLHFHGYVPSEYRSDAKQLMKDVFAEYHMFITMSDAYHAWKSFSDSMAASWMMLDTYTQEQRADIVKNQCQDSDYD